MEYSYDDCCRVIGEMVLNTKAQLTQAQKLIEQQNKKIAELQEELRHSREMFSCNTPNENIS